MPDPAGDAPEPSSSRGKAPRVWFGAVVPSVRLVLVVLIAYLLVGYAVTGIIRYLAGAPSAPAIWEIDPNQIPAQTGSHVWTDYAGGGAIGAVILGLFLRRRPIDPALRSVLGWTRARRSTVALSLVGGFLLPAFAGYVKLGDAAGRDQFFAALLPIEGWPSYVLCVYLVVGAPFVEELLFRGFAYGSLLRRWGAFPAFLITTLVFVQAHVPLYWVWFAPVVLISFVPFVFVSMVNCRLRRRTGSIFPAVAFHAGYNLGTVGSALVYHWTLRPV